MSTLSEADSELFDQFLDTLIRKLLDGTIDQSRARQSLKKAILLVAAGNPNISFFLESQIQVILDQGPSHG